MIRSMASVASAGDDEPIEQHAELVAAEPGDGVLAADAGAEPVGDHHQGRVAGAVAEAVVEPLEAVEVAVAGRRSVLPSRFADEQRVLDPVGEQGPVGQAGQRVVEGLVAELGLEGVALGHVAGVEDDAARRPRRREGSSSGSRCGATSRRRGGAGTRDTA